MKPVIGISPTPRETDMDHGHFRQYGLSDTYTRSILAAGGIPVILPLHTEAVDDVLDSLDGIIFSGGSDLNSAHWGEAPHPKAYGFDDERDSFELQTVRKVVERNMPMLGICRGIQSINVALGGTIIQDIPDQVPGSIQHRQHENGKTRDDVSHPVRITEGENLLYKIHGHNTMVTNSFHHQAVKELADDLEVIAVAEDGVVEAVWLPGMTFGLAVQWHPEMLADRHPEHAALFAALVKVAAERSAERRSSLV